MNVSFRKSMSLLANTCLFSQMYVSFRKCMSLFANTCLFSQMSYLRSTHERKRHTTNVAVVRLFSKMYVSFRKSLTYAVHMKERDTQQTSRSYSMSLSATVFHCVLPLFTEGDMSLFANVCLFSQIHVSFRNCISLCASLIYRRGHACVLLAQQMCLRYLELLAHLWKPNSL